MQDPQTGDIRATLALSQAEALNGTTRVLNLPGGRQVTVPIPAGIRDGQEIRLADQSTSTPGYGTLILSIAVAPENYQTGYQPMGTDYPTEFIRTPPPPPPSSTSYPATGSGDPYTNPPYQGMGESSTYISQPSQPAFTQPSQPGPQQQPRRGRSFTATILLAVLVLLLLGGGLLYYTAVIRPAQLYASATATAQATVGSTAQVTATSTHQTVATATATPDAAATATAQANAQTTATATALQNIYIQATSGTPVLTDALSSQDNNNWDDDSSCTFTGGAYHVISPDKDTYITCNAQSSNFSNFTFQVHMTMIKGDYGGIVFRSNSQETNFYDFTLDQAGSYSLEAYKNDNYLKTLSGGPASAFKIGMNISNEITVVAKGTTFYLYVNGQFVASASDNTYGAGQIGLLGGNTTHPADVKFNGVKVWNA